MSYRALIGPYRPYKDGAIVIIMNIVQHLPSSNDSTYCIALLLL